MRRTREPGPLDGRPLGPVFEARFDVASVPVHVLVVRGEAELLDQARDAAGDLLGLWSGPDGDLERLAGARGEPVAVRPETIALLALAELAGSRTSGRFAFTRPGPARLDVDALAGVARLEAGASLHLGGVERALVADIVARDLLEAGAQGVCVNVGGDVRVDGLPPRLEGWSVDLDVARPGSSLMLADGAVAARSGGRGGCDATVWALTAWSAAALAYACTRCDDVDEALSLLEAEGARGEVRDPRGPGRRTPGWASAQAVRADG